MARRTAPNVVVGPICEECGGTLVAKEWARFTDVQTEWTHADEVPEGHSDAIVRPMWKHVELPDYIWPMLLGQ